MFSRRPLIVCLLGFWLLAGSGCALVPDVVHQPTIHNPFPQLSKVAIVPFFNMSLEPTVDGMKVAELYYTELQDIPGFEVVPVGLVDSEIKRLKLSLDSPEDAQKLARQLGVDAVVVGVVTDYTPFYPPRLGIQVQWFGANPGFHPIPPGYGLPWGTPAEEQIPEEVVLQAEMALAKAQLETQTPHCPIDSEEKKKPSQEGDQSSPQNADLSADLAKNSAPEVIPTPETIENPGLPGLPANWPDPNGFIPSPPQKNPAPCSPSNKPILEHTAIYRGNDAEFTQALEDYYQFRDDARFGGWQSYLQRSDDFIQFCCRMHIWEMLTARGAAGESRVVWRWSKDR